MAGKRNTKIKRKPHSIYAQLDRIENRQAGIEDWQKNHEKHDDDRFEDGQRTMAKLATKEDFDKIHALLVDEDGMPTFAEKKDVSPVVDFYEKLVLSGVILGVAGKWSNKLILGGAALLIAWGVLTGGFKAIIVAAVAWATGGLK